MTLLPSQLRASSAAFVLLALAGTALPVDRASASDDTGWVDQAFAAPQTARTAQPTVRRRSVVSVVRVTERASLSGSLEPSQPPSARPSLSTGGVTWQAASNCVPGSLRSVLSGVVSTFGPITVTSTCRGAAQNRAAGGAGSSYHLTGQAVDFRVGTNTGAVYAYLAANSGVGGLKHYGGGLFHIDTGPRRSW